MTQPRHIAIVLAADRGPADPVARASGAPCKSLTPVAGKAMLWRVIDALQQTAAIDEIILVGPSQNILESHPELKDMLKKAGITWVAPAASPSASAAKAMRSVANDKPVLLTTADHALLQPAMVEALLTGSTGKDFTLAMVTYEDVMRAYPNTRRTAIRLRPGKGYCGCNLFTINTAKGRQLIDLWQSVESQRKHPAKLVIGMLGWGAVLRYVIGRLSLDQAFARLSRTLEMDVGPVLLTDPSAAIDVDSIADLRLVEDLLASNRKTQPG